MPVNSTTTRDTDFCARLDRRQFCVAYFQNKELRYCIRVSLVASIIKLALGVTMCPCRRCSRSIAAIAVPLSILSSLPAHPYEFFPNMKFEHAQINSSQANQNSYPSWPPKHLCSLYVRVHHPLKPQAPQARNILTTCLTDFLQIGHSSHCLAHSTQAQTCPQSKNSASISLP